MKTPYRYIIWEFREGAGWTIAAASYDTRATAETFAQTLDGPTEIAEVLPPLTDDETEQLKKGSRF